MTKIEQHAKAAAAAHGITANTSTHEEFRDGSYTGLFAATVSFEQIVAVRPENKFIHPNAARVIGISATDARRLFKSRKGVPGGQDYTPVRASTAVMIEVAETADAAERALLDRILAGEARRTAHDVADRACEIETEMRRDLRDSIAKANEAKSGPPG